MGVPVRTVSFLVGLLSVASTLFAAPPVVASVGNLVCDEGEACVWSDDDYQGCFADFLMPSKLSSYTRRDARWNNCPGNLNDKISSYQNRSQYWFFMFEDVDYQRRKFCGGPGASTVDLSNLKDIGENPEDEMSSHSYSTGAPPRCGTVDNGPRCCDWRDEN